MIVIDGCPSDAPGSIPVTGWKNTYPTPGFDPGQSWGSYEASPGDDRLGDRSFTLLRKSR
jgi:hypothetical protein